MHGDAAFAGQGVVAETLNLSQLRGYRPAAPCTSSSTTSSVHHLAVGVAVELYCTDIARMIAAPIFHVNGDDPEACVRVAQLALEYRREFHKDVVIDMVCYRRWAQRGRQPVVHPAADVRHHRRQRSVRKLYTEELVGRGDITLEDAEDALQDFQGQLEKVFVETRNATGQRARPSRRSRADPSQQVTTAVTLEVIKPDRGRLREPTGRFTVHPRLKPQIDRRVAMASAGDVDWATAELFAFGSLVLEGTPGPAAGQDSRRGTFTQRHAALIDRNTGEGYPAGAPAKDQAPFWGFDSPLIEFATLGFEYGYCVVRQDALVWEAQLATSSTARS